MIRTLFAVLIVAAIPSWGVADDEKLDYYPLAEGNKWSYRVSGGGITTTLATEVTAVKKKKGMTVATVVTRAVDGTTFTEQISANDMGVSRDSVVGVRVSAPLTIIKYPIKSGEMWRQELMVNEKRALAITKVGKEVEIQVPAGKYKAVPHESNIFFGGENLKGTVWYSAGVGVVKQEAPLGDIAATMELTKFTPGPAE